MAELPLYPVLEVDLGDWILRLDGTVFELFRRGVDRRRDPPPSQAHGGRGEAARDGLRLTSATRSAGWSIGHKLDVPAAQRDEVMAFFSESRRRRDAYALL